MWGATISQDCLFPPHGGKIMSDTIQVTAVLLIIAMLLIITHPAKASSLPELDKTPVFLQAKYPKQIKSKAFIEKMGPIPMWQCLQMLVRYNRYYQRMLSYPPKLSCKHIKKVKL